MRSASLILLTFFIISCLNCKKETTEIVETGKIYGTVVLNAVNYSIPIENIDSLGVILIRNSVVQNKTYTDEGYFRFNRVITAEYLIAADFGGMFQIPGQSVNLRADTNLNSGIFNIEPVGDTVNSGKYLIFVILDVSIQRGITVAFDKTSEAYVDWEVYDLRGNLVRAITGYYNPQIQIRTHSATWNLRNQYNLDCPAGIYFIVTDDETVSNLLPI